MIKERICKILPKRIFGWVLTGSVEWMLIPTIVMYSDQYFKVNIELRWLAWGYGNQYGERSPG